MKNLIFLILIVSSAGQLVAQMDFQRDQTFNPPDCIGLGYDMLVIEDTSIILNHLGTSLFCTGNNQFTRMARLNLQDGSYDYSFWAYPPLWSTVKLYHFEDHIYHYISSRFHRYSPYGPADESWSPSYDLEWSEIFGVQYLSTSDRLLIIGALFPGNHETRPPLELSKSCLWYDLDGAIDSSFNSPILHKIQDITDETQHINIIRNWVYSQETDYAYIFVYTDFANNHHSYKVFRMFSNGQIDTSFQVVKGEYINEIHGLHGMFEQEDGKVILSGSFHLNEGGNSLFSTLIRLNLDGSFDPTFNYKNNTLPIGFDPEVQTELLGQNVVHHFTHWKDDIYIISGNFINYEGQYRGKIAVVDKNGFLVEDYFRGTGFTEMESDFSRIADIRKTIVLAPDTLLVCGRYVAFNDEPYTPGVMKLVLESPTSTPETSEPLNIKAYPNPTTGIVTLESDRYTGVSTGTIHPKVTITDQLGRVLKQDIWPSGQRFDIDISQLSDGVYFIRLHEGSQVVWTDRLVKVSGR